MNISENGRKICSKKWTPCMKITWELVKIPDGKKNPTKKYFYKIKHDGERKKERYKKRLREKGYVFPKIRHLL